MIIIFVSLINEFELACPAGRADFLFFGYFQKNFLHGYCTYAKYFIMLKPGGTAGAILYIETL